MEWQKLTIQRYTRISIKGLLFKQFQNPVCLRSFKTKSRET